MPLRSNSGTDSLREIAFEWRADSLHKTLDFTSRHILQCTAVFPSAEKQLDRHLSEEQKVSTSIMIEEKSEDKQN